MALVLFLQKGPAMSGLRFLTLLSFSFLVAAGCSEGPLEQLSGGSRPHGKIKDQGQDREVYKIEDTVHVEKPQVMKQGQLQFIQGATQLKSSQIAFDERDKTLRLQGELLLKTSPSRLLELDLEGSLNAKGEAVLRPILKDQLPPGMRLGAKALCLNASIEGYDCDSAVIDIFVENGDKIYVHQIEYQKDNKLESKSPVKDEANEEVKVGRYVGELSQNVIKEALQEPSVADVLGLDEESLKSTFAQAIGAPTAGSLLQSLDYSKAKNKHVRLLRQGLKRYYSTHELAFILNKMAQDSMVLANRPLLVGDLSAEHGGPIKPHQSHQTGLDADVAYLVRGVETFVKIANGDTLVKDVMLPQQWELFKRTVATGYVDRMFVHQNLKKALCEYAKGRKEVDASSKEGIAFETLRRLRPDKDHVSHFHLRVKCSQVQKRCRQMEEPAKTTGCF